MLHGRILEQGLEAIYNEIELPIAPLLHRIERAGLRVDTSVLGELSALFGAELEKLTAQIYKVAGREFKINSPKQVGEVLEELNISTKRKTATGQVSTSRAVLDELAAQGYELPRLLIEFRELDKLKATYTDALPALVGPDGRIHSQLNQTVTATGRLSSSEPNLQNIPIRTELGRRIRRAFVPEEGNVFVAADYSQLELRLLAHVTRDEQMLDAFRKDEDIHERTARLVFGARTKEELKEKRRFAKIVNFAIAYAVEPFGLSQRVGISRKEARQVIDDYYKTYTGVRRFMEEIPEQARETGRRALHLRPHPPRPDHQRPQRQHPRPRRTRSHQHAHPGERERHRQDRDAEGGRGAACGGPEGADGDAGARRAAGRGAVEGGEAGRGDSVPRDGDGRRAGRAARSRGRRRRQLDGREEVEW